ncbi:hypothetical protein CBS101457_005475 [Exobasidium rhododendri]|nr:hypothetical protein CBS101457_005475 [Exobasidium rhododendri]
MTDKGVKLGLGADEEPTINTSSIPDIGEGNGAVHSGKHAGETVPSSGEASTISYGEHAGGLAPATSEDKGDAKVNHASLGKNTEGLVLFDLTVATGARKAFSPHCMKTVLDLKLLSIGYDRQRVTFTQVRNELESRVGENVTVPTLELANGSHLTDSWNIAQYLYEEHEHGSLLFPTSSSKMFAKFIEGFGKLELGPNLGPLTRVDLLNHLDEDSQEYFENVKIGKAKMDKFRSMTRSDKEKSIDTCIAALEPIEAVLILARSESKSRQVWLEGGSHPTHADFALYGWQVYSRVSGPKVTKAVWNAHPAVAKWVQDMNDWASPDITGDYF